MPSARSPSPALALPSGPSLPWPGRIYRRFAAVLEDYSNSDRLFLQLR